eukprot:1453761-Alexandrium_andersonii.AAC.1
MLANALLPENTTKRQRARKEKRTERKPHFYREPYCASETSLRSRTPLRLSARKGPGAAGGLVKSATTRARREPRLVL